MSVINYARIKERNKVCKVIGCLLCKFYPEKACFPQQEIQVKQDLFSNENM